MGIAGSTVPWQGYRLKLWRGGSGLPLLLLHGAGPGASTMGNWGHVLEPLGRHFSLHAMDFIGFGQSDRKTKPPYFDPALWENQIQFLLDQVPGKKVGILAHSLSAPLALKIAARNTRVHAVLTTGAAGAAHVYSANLETIWTFPRTRAALVAALKVLVFDKRLLTKKFIDDRFTVLASPGYGEYFESMFSGDKRRLIDSVILPNALLKSLRCKLSMIHGLNDLATPWQTSSTIASAVAQGEVLLINRCGHSPALEYPAKVVTAARCLFET